MFLNTYKNKLATYIFSLVVLIAFYSFGTFGFLNLFDLRNSFQFLIVLFSFFGLISIVVNLKTNKVYSNLTLIVVMLGFLYYGVMLAFIKGEILTTLVQSFLMLIFTIYLLLVDIKLINRISKNIVIVTFIFSLMGVFAYFAFFFNKSLIHEVNFQLFDSTIGSATIYAKSWVEYFSFTSGDGFELFGTNSTRIKGFSNEPSATIVHYLAPIGLAFFFSQKYRYIGWFLLVFNFICIASGIAWLIVFGSIILYIIMSIKNNLLKKSIIFLSIFLVIFILLNPELAVSLVLDIGRLLYELTSSSLFARKEGSATIRLMSLAIAIDELKNNIFGGSSYSTMTGLLINISLVGGIFLFIVFILFTKQFIKLGIKKFTVLSDKNVKFGISFILSTFIAALLLSNYGWDRIPGVIMILLFYRHLKEGVEVVPVSISRNQII